MVTVTGRPDARELAAVLAVVARQGEPPRRLEPLTQWRATRRAALRRTAQQTR